MEAEKEGLKMLLNRFVEALESRVSQTGELVLSSVRRPIEGETLRQATGGLYSGMTPEFLDLVKSLCQTDLEWMQMYAELLKAMSDPSSEVSRRLGAIGDRLWMQSKIGDVCVWHTAFPPLDGGGSSQAGSFVEVLKPLLGDQPRERCLEWCSGPGFLGFSVLNRGLCQTLVLADINPRVAPGIERTIAENGLEGLVSYYISDNLRQVPKSLTFDLVLGNPPWAYRKIEGLANPLIPNDPGWGIHREFFSTVGERLTSQALLVVSCYEPFLSTAYIDEMTEPWDVRPRPPIEDFRRFMREGGLALQKMVKLPPDPMVELSQGLVFMVAAPAKENSLELQLMGLGGEEIPIGGDSLPEPPSPSALSHLFGQDTLPGYRRFQAAEYVVKANLAQRPLSAVLPELFGEHPPDFELLEACGVSREVVEQFGLDGTESRAVQPAGGYRLVEEHALATVRKVRVQLTQDAPVCVGLKALMAWVRAFGETIETVVTVKPGARVDTLSSLLGETLGESSARISFWRQGHQTLFAQDSAKLVRHREEGEALWVPTQGSSHRPGDQMQPGLLPLVASKLAWEGGNILSDGHRLLVGANSVATNMRALGLSDSQVMKLFQDETGLEPLVLGDLQMALESMAWSQSGYAVPHVVDGGQADFHLDVDCCLLGPVGVDGAPVALVADAEAGLAFLDEVLAQDALFEGHFVSPARARKLYWELLERSAERRVEILSGYVATLKSAGYQVARVPDQRLVAEHNYLARKNFFYGYCNAFLLQHRGRATAALLPLGLQGMEARVEDLYREFGVEVHWVGDSETGQEMAAMRGGLHCFCSKLG